MRGAVLKLNAQKGWIKPMGSIYSTNIRMHLSIKVSCSFVIQYSIVANTWKMVSWLLWCTNIQKALSNDALSIAISHIQGHKKVNPDKVLVLINSSLWQSTEARTLSGFDCSKPPDTFKLRVSKKNREKRQASTSAAASTTAVETPQHVPKPVSPELSEYEQKGKQMSGS